MVNKRKEEWRHSSPLVEVGYPAAEIDERMSGMRVSTWLDSDQLVLLRNPTEKEYLLAVELLVQQRQKQIRYMEEKELTNIYRKWR